MGWSRLLTICTALQLLAFADAARPEWAQLSGQFAENQHVRRQNDPDTESMRAPGLPGAPLCNTPLNRQCWGRNDINTDYYTTRPSTGVTRQFNFIITQGTGSPDGVNRFMQLVNGQYPGPPIEANWGDDIVVRITNLVQNNGTAIHFHGIRQLNTFQQDGVPGVTQCPIPPGKTMVYRWKAEQYGTSWYHSHWSLQAWEGVLGPIIIHGPASANYDVDLGPVLIQDWSHRTVDQLWDEAQTVGPPTMETGLINGKNVWQGGGSRYDRRVIKGRKYLIRLVNVAIDTLFTFSIDNHTLTVIATDFVPIQPYQTNFVRIGISQRYDIIVEANDPANAGSYWMRAVPQLSCSPNGNPDDIKGIVYYGLSHNEPTTQPYTMADNCLNEPVSQHHPVVQRQVGAVSSNVKEQLTVSKPNGFFKWFLNTTSLRVDWSQPSILSAYTDQPYTNQSGVVKVNGGPNDWVYFVIQSVIPVPHPIHLHGHDFFVVAEGDGLFDETVLLNLNNPARRDVQMLPAAGFLAIAFPMDNPGIWLLHCHIGWHQSEGLAMQFVENEDQLDERTNAEQMNDICDTWSFYFRYLNPNQYDSGVRRYTLPNTVFGR